MKISRRLNYNFVLFVVLFVLVNGADDLGIKSSSSLKQPETKDKSGFDKLKYDPDGPLDGNYLNEINDGSMTRSISNSETSDNSREDKFLDDLFKKRINCLHCSSTFSGWLQGLGFGKKVDVDIIPIRKTELFGSIDDERDRQFAQSLYVNPNGTVTTYDIVNILEYEIIAGMVPILGSPEALKKNLRRDQILPDLNSTEFSQFLEMLRQYALGRFNLEPDGMDPDFEVEIMKSFVEKMVLCSIGKGSTLPLEELWRIGFESQRVLFTARDIFYYPGLLKLAALFNIEFDLYRANAFLDQFINTFYSGVYGPRRTELFYIARIQNIPESVLSDALLRSSEDDSNPALAEELRKAIEEQREIFMDPENRNKLYDLHGERALGYQELDPLPKTLDDVLDVTELILMKNWIMNFSPSPSPSQSSCSSPSSSSLKNLAKAELNIIRQHVQSPQNIEIMQSFYLDIFSPSECKDLLASLMLNLGSNNFKSEYRDHMGSFLYAAFIKSCREKDDDSVLITFDEIRSNLESILSLQISLNDFEI